MIVVTYTCVQNPPVGGLAANPIRLSFKNKLRVKGNLLTRRLSCEPDSPKFEKILPSEEQASHSGA
jgi:hypothetical protein